MKTKYRRLKVLTIVLLGCTFAFFLYNLIVRVAVDRMVQHTGLPVIYIETDGTELSKENYLDCQVTVKYSNDSIFKSLARIKGRGNATWNRDKKAYNIKFDKKVACLGLSEAKKFVLLANDCDWSLCRTAVGMKLGQLANVEWPLHCEYAELVFNGIPQGNYLLSEAVEIADNRISIGKEDGVVLEFRYEEQLNTKHDYFRSNVLTYLFEVKDSGKDRLTNENFSIIKDKIAQFDIHILTLNPTDTNLEDFLDIDSFVKWYYCDNVLQMDECNRYYVIEYEKPTIKMGPLWDFDWTLGINMFHQRYDSCSPRNVLYFKALSENHYFMTKVAEFHFQNRDRIESELMCYFKETTEKIRKSQQLNEFIWHRCRNGHVVWEDELKADQQYLHNTFLWLDDYLKPFHASKADVDL